MSKTNIQKLAEEFEEWDIPNSVSTLPQDKYNEIQTLAGKMLAILKGKGS